MSQPDDIQLDCIGCGTKNPIGAEVCSGCGHRFAGPGGGQRVRPLPAMAPEPEEAAVFSQYPRPTSDTSFLGCLGKVIGILVAIVASIIAFVVTFFITCTSLPGNGDFTLIWSVLAGLGAVGLVVTVAIWIGSLFGKNQSRR